MNDNQIILRRERWLDKVETFMLFLAFIAVTLYMMELLGTWSALGVEKEYNIVSFVIDLTFVINLLVKIVVLRNNYLNSPWFVIDLISSLPILAYLTLLPGSFEALRFVRGFRLFRALRALRMLNVIPILKFNTTVTYVTRETTALKYAMWVIMPVYTVVFTILVNWMYHYYTGQAPLLEFYLILGSLLGLALAIFITYYQVPATISVQVSRLLNVALPNQVANHFMKHPEDYSHTVKMPATIIFCDIKNFTKTAEKLQHDFSALKYNLEYVMNVITEIHCQYDLIIDKFIGDAVMSFRGGDLVDGTPEKHAWCVVKAALTSLKAIHNLNNPYFHEIKIGGASAEAALIGAFGTSSRLSYTILGDRVNLAARLEAAVKQCGTKNLFCDRTYNLLKDCKDFIWRRFGKIQVEGKSIPLDIYEVFDSDDMNDVSWLEHYHLALINFETKQFQSALEGFLRANELCPGGDLPSKYYIECCHTLIATPPDHHWTPIFISLK